MSNLGLVVKYCQADPKNDLTLEQSRKDNFRLRKSSVVVEASMVSTLFLRMCEGSSWSIVQSWSSKKRPQRKITHGKKSVPKKATVHGRTT